jgi:hypothetical protein
MWADGLQSSSAVGYEIGLPARINYNSTIYLTQAAREHYIQFFAKDPSYTDVDREVLDQAGVTTVDDPHGFPEVDGSTAVFSFGPNIPDRSWRILLDQR